MMNRPHRWLLSSEIFLAWLVLFALLFYTYLEIFAAPYLGFNFDPVNGTVSVYPDFSQQGLATGDRLVEVNTLHFADWTDDLSAPLFPNISPGDVIDLQVQRKSETEGKIPTEPLIERVQWHVPGFNWDEFNSRTRNAWWLGYLFWIFGLATLLVVRPLDAKRRLLAAFFLLTALWLTIGNTSRWGIAESRIVYRMVLIFSTPVLLQLHWLYPRSLGSILPSNSPIRAQAVGWIAYGLTAVVALMQWFQLVPSDTGVLAFGLALLGSIVLLILHYVMQPDVRGQLRLLLMALVFAVLPVAGLAFAFVINDVPSGGSFALLALPLLPGAYFYSIYRYQLGGSEFRANRLIAVYLFLILLASLIPSFSALIGDPTAAGGVGLINTVEGVLIALIALYGFPPFQRFVERRLLAMPLPPIQLIDTYLERITITLNEASLIQLLRNEVLPSLLIRQSALLRIRNNVATEFYSTGEALTPEVVETLVAYLRREAVYRRPVSPDVLGTELYDTGWVRVGLALQVEGKLIGIWLLGRHDPDDLYSPFEVATLQTLARQTALALANIDQAAQLQALYQASIERQEQERMKMAHLLHDAILNQAAALYMGLDSSALTPRVEHDYLRLKEQIHQLISNLRPPSLDLGLNAALEELAEELDQREHSKFTLQLDLSPQPVSYPPQIENHIFRIVQQACENAFRHAQAKQIQISGTLAPNRVELTIEDDGVGFVLGKPLNLAHLLANKHFGLVHMMERAEHIHADLELDSRPGNGTRVRLTWSGNESAAD